MTSLERRIRRAEASAKRVQIGRKQGRRLRILTQEDARQFEASVFALIRAIKQMPPDERAQLRQQARSLLERKNAEQRAHDLGMAQWAGGSPMGPVVLRDAHAEGGEAPL
jgi:hypothetical protein